MDARLSRGDLFITASVKLADLSATAKSGQCPSTHYALRRHEFLGGSVESGWRLDTSGGAGDRLAQNWTLSRWSKGWRSSAIILHRGVCPVLVTNQRRQRLRF